MKYLTLAKAVLTESKTVLWNITLFQHPDASASQYSSLLATNGIHILKIGKCETPSKK